MVSSSVVHKITSYLTTPAQIIVRAYSSGDFQTTTAFLATSAPTTLNMASTSRVQTTKFTSTTS